MAVENLLKMRTNAIFNQSRYESVFNQNGWFFCAFSSVKVQHDVFFFFFPLLPSCCLRMGICFQTNRTAKNEYIMKTVRSVYARAYTGQHNEEKGTQNYPRINEKLIQILFHVFAECCSVSVKGEEH